MKGIIYASIANSIWGILPLYWAQFQGVSFKFILASRMILSFILGVFIIRKKLPVWIQCFKNKDFLKYTIFCSVMIMLNWASYIYAMVNQKIIESSLGYFIQPLLVILMGMIFLKEPLNRFQNIAVFIVFLSLGMVTYFEGLPLLSIVLASTFAMYSYLKKIYYRKIDQNKDSKNLEELPHFDTFYFVVAESLWMLPFAIGVLIWLGTTQEPIQASYMQLTLLLFSGAVTLFPIGVFAKATQLLSLSSLGFLQFIGPISQFVIGYFVFKEPLIAHNLYGFILIWIAVILSLIPSKKMAKKPA